LEKLDIKSGKAGFFDNMINCYEIYKSYGFVSALEFTLIEAWFRDLENIS